MDSTHISSSSLFSIHLKQQELRSLLVLVFSWSHVFVISSALTPFSAGKHRCLSQQKSVLVNLRQDILLNHSSTSPPPPPDSSSSDSSLKLMLWDLKRDCCSWEGVECDAAGRIIGLDLSYSMISGNISAILQLHHLKKLNLAGNNFHLAPIPSGLHKLRKLTHLDLSYSSFSGQIPSGISFLSELILKGNPLGTVAPNFLANFKNLVLLDLASCDLHGSFNSDIFLLPRLQRIDISWNPLLVGELPDFSIHSHLQELSMSGSNFSGLIPSSLANLSEIVILNLSKNKFVGSMPPFQGNSVPKLQFLDFSGNGLDKTIGSSLFNLPSLQTLKLNDNRFHGQIEEFPNASSSLLEFASFDNNDLEGPVPISFTLLPNLASLSFKSNFFNGTVKLDRFENLKLLDLSDNNLSIEHINDNLVFPNLSDLDLSYCNLTGFLLSIDRVDGSLIFPNLLNLKLIQCNLTEFPSFLENLTSIFTLHLSNNHIRSYVPWWIWKESLTLLDLSYNPVDLPDGLLFRVPNDSNSDGSTSFPILQRLSMRSCNVSRFPQFLKIPQSLSWLDFSDNKLEGRVPNWIWQMKNLDYLNLSHNSLHALEFDLLNPSFTPLTVLDVHENVLRGPFPMGICNMSHLRILDASENQMRGMIPECLSKLESLTVLILRKNGFHSMPSDFARLKILKLLNINGNFLKGQLPRSLTKCTSLVLIDLGNNMLSDIFPFWLDKLPVLKVLILGDNQFYGPMERPGTQFSFPELHILDLSSNAMSGELFEDFFQGLKAMAVTKVNKSAPLYIGDRHYYSVTLTSKGLQMELLKILTELVVLDLSNNKLQGEIPKEIGNLKSLIVLNLSSNGLAGKIPSTIGKLSQLESLDLSQNDLSGNIPSQLSDLTFLSALNLSYNQLDGRIPRGPQMNLFSNDSYRGNIGLCGWPLSKTCKEESGDALPQQPEDDDGDDHENSQKPVWEFVLMGYGCGLMIGFSIGYISWNKMESIWLLKLIAVKIIMQRERRHSNGGRFH